MLFDPINWQVTLHKTRQVFSGVPIDQAHKQNYALIKGDGGAIGLTDNPSTLQCWMVAGPEVARVVEEFHKNFNHCSFKTNTAHHDQAPNCPNFLWQGCTNPDECDGRSLQSFQREK